MHVTSLIIIAVNNEEYEEIISESIRDIDFADVPKVVLRVF